jgi:hypothetical protein
VITSVLLSPQYHAKRNFRSESAATLEAESGYSLEASEVTEFRQYILNADWANAEFLLSHLTTTDDEAIWVRSTRVRIIEPDDLTHLFSGGALSHREAEIPRAPGSSKNDRCAAGPA